VEKAKLRVKAESHLEESRIYIHTCGV